MATLIIGAAFAALAPVGYAATAFSIGSMLGSILFPSPPNKLEGPRINDLKIQSSAYGNTIPIVYGNVRIAGNVIWSSDIIESASTTSSSGGGKGGTSGGTTTTNYTYSVNSAIMVCEGPITNISKIWADGVLIYDTLNATPIALEGVITIYGGDEYQNPDPTIESFLGAGNVPAYRGRSYVVFTDLELITYGNRLPSFTFLIQNSLEGAVSSYQYYISGAANQLNFCEDVSLVVPYVNGAGSSTYFDYAGKVIAYDIDKKVLATGAIGINLDISTGESRLRCILAYSDRGSFLNYSNDSGQFFSVFDFLQYNPIDKLMYGINEQGSLIMGHMSNVLNLPSLQVVHPTLRYITTKQNNYFPAYITAYGALLDPINNAIVVPSTNYLAKEYSLFALINDNPFSPDNLVKELGNAGAIIFDIPTGAVKSHIIFRDGFQLNSAGMTACTGGKFGGAPYVFVPRYYDTYTNPPDNILVDGYTNEFDNIYYYYTAPNTTGFQIAEKVDMRPYLPPVIYNNHWLPFCGVKYDYKTDCCWFVSTREEYTSQYFIAANTLITVFDTKRRVLKHSIMLSNYGRFEYSLGNVVMEMDSENYTFWIVAAYISSFSTSFINDGAILVNTNIDFNDYNASQAGGVIGFDTRTGKAKYVILGINPADIAIAPHSVFFSQFRGNLFKFDYPGYGGTGTTSIEGMTARKIVGDIYTRCNLYSDIPEKEIVPLPPTNTIPYSFDGGIQNQRPPELVSSWVIYNEDSHSGGGCLSTPPGAYLQDAISAQQFNNPRYYTAIVVVPIGKNVEGTFITFWVKFKNNYSKNDFNGLGVSFGTTLFAVLYYEDAFRGNLVRFDPNYYVEGSLDANSWLQYRLPVPTKAPSITFAHRGCNQPNMVLIDELNLRGPAVADKAIEGFVIPTQTTAATALEQLKNTLFFDLVESDSQVKLVFKGAPSVVAIPFKDLIVSNG